MIWRARGNVSGLSNNVAWLHEAPVLLFATGVPEIGALLSNGLVIGCEASAWSLYPNRS
jgi:hypothetical protein